jgi:hypothetical protein
MSSRHRGMAERGLDQMNRRTVAPEPAYANQIAQTGRTDISANHTCIERGLA